jgi:hypothetical protein
VTYDQPTGRGNRPGFRVITLATIVIVVAGGLGALGAYLLTGHGNSNAHGSSNVDGSSNAHGITTQPQTPRNCRPSAMLVNPCRPWFGAAANGNPGAPDSRVAQFDYLEKLVGQRLDIFRDYHSPPGSNALGDLPLNGDELQIARRRGTYIDVNWKPAPTFALADGRNRAVNRQIDQVAASIKSIAPRKIFMTIWWEPQNDVTSDPGGNCYLKPGAAGGSTREYIAMWRNVERRFRAAGVTNVIWVMDYQAPEDGMFDCLVPRLWPGNNLVDWVVYDAYSRNPYATWDDTVGRFYHVLSDDSTPRANFKSKPWGLGEFGTCSNPSADAASDFYVQAKSAFNANAYPRLKMYLAYTSASGPKAGPGCLSNYNQNGQPDAAKQAKFNEFARAVLARR